MKITDPSIIKRGEQELLSAIKETLDWKIIEKLNSNDSDSRNLACVGSDIVVHGNQVAYQMDFEVKMRVRVLFDREGNLIQPDGAAASPPPETIHGEMPVQESFEELALNDISDEAIADIENELKEINAIHQEADEMLATLGMPSEELVSMQTGEDDSSDPRLPIEESSLVEEILLPSDDQLGVLEEIIAPDPSGELKTALSKSQGFWLQGQEKTASPQRETPPEPDPLKEALKKSQHFWQSNA